MSNRVIRQEAKGQLINHLRSVTIPWKCPAQSAVAAVKYNLINAKEWDQLYISTLSRWQCLPSVSQSTWNRVRGAAQGPHYEAEHMISYFVPVKPSLPLTHLLGAGLWYPAWWRPACPSTSWSWCTLSCLILLRTGPGVLSQLKMRCVLESCSSSSCSNCNSLLAKVWCLTWMYLRYLLKYTLRIIPIAVDFTQRSFYFISSKEIKGKKLWSLSQYRDTKNCIFLWQSLSAASGVEAVNLLRN